MKLPKEDLLKGCFDRVGMEELIDLADAVLRTKQPRWCSFISGRLKEEAMERMQVLTSLQIHSDGGYPGAERQMLLFQHNENEDVELQKTLPIKGLKVEGNFLFDQPSAEDIRTSLLSMGVESNGIGDIWIKGDRGANVLCKSESSNVLNGLKGKLREVAFHCEQVNLDELQLPLQRRVRDITTIEASCRIDAVASAGFGVSRAKITKQIKGGFLRLNWETISQPSRILEPGDRIHLKNRGTIEIISTDLTKRNRWRIQLIRW